MLRNTQLLRAWAGGDQDALARLTPRVYGELRRIAGYFMRDERQGRTIQTTALVDEAYLKLIDVSNVGWQHRAHFFAVSAQIMRHILLDRAPRRVAAKRGGAAAQVNLDEVADIGSGRARELIALDDALDALAKVDPRKARVIEMRFFAGLSVEETAEVLRVSSDTVKRDWRLARVRGCWPSLATRKTANAKEKSNSFTPFTLDLRLEGEADRIGRHRLECK
jgi:RNA polymerase sigma factor (TIGR02999 family)